MSVVTVVLETTHVVLASSGSETVDPSVITKFTDYFKDHSEHILAIVFIDIAIVMVVARLVGALFKRIRQPAVVGEILAGIMLGPSLLGLIPGSWFGLETSIPTWLFPPEVRPFLNVLANVGLIIFMFIVGLELDMKLIRGRERVAAGISLSSIVLPFTLGILLAWVIYNAQGKVEKVADGATSMVPVDFWPFALFLGVAMSITAFPVLARILTERGMHRTEVGAISLAAAAVDDIIAWSLLALVLAIVSASGGGGVTALVRIAGLSILFVIVMFVVVKPQLARLVTHFEKAGRLTPNVLSVVLIGVLVSAYLTSTIGIHGIFGAFLFGAVMPREGAEDFTHEILSKLEQVSVLLLLPLFFIVTGLNVDITQLFRQPALLGLLVAVMVVAVSGKFFGAAVAARAQGYGWSHAFSIGTLMNTRGLTELVILNAGLSAGVLNREMFTVLVCMAVLTTIMTEPLLRLFYPDAKLKADIAAAEKAQIGELDAYRVVVSVGDVDSLAASNLVDLAIALVGDERPAQIVLSRFLPQTAKLELGSGMVGELGSFADNLGGLHTLTQRCEQAGVPSLVRSQFSTDEVGDLLSQAEAVEADVLLVADRGGAASSDGTAGAAWPDPRLAAGDLPFTVVALTNADARIDLDPEHAVVVIAGERAESGLDVGARVARTRRAPLAVSSPSDRKGARRADGLVSKLSEVLDVGRQIPGTADAIGMVIQPLDGGPADLGISGGPEVVRATVIPGTGSERSWDRLTARLAEPGSSPPTAEPVGSSAGAPDAAGAESGD